MRLCNIVSVVIFSVKRIFSGKYRFLWLYWAGFLSAYLAGFRATINHEYWQLLDPVHLENRFWESIINLHSQPPLINVLLGASLHLKKLTGILPETSLVALGFILGCAAVLVITRLAESMITNRIILSAVIIPFIFNPYLYSSIYIYFYTIYELFFLSLMAYCAYRYFREPRLVTYIYICMLTIAMVYTRSLFHFIWPFPILIGLPLLIRHRVNNFQKSYFIKITACILITLLVLMAWPIKNYIKFDVFGYSSWQGYNLSRELVPSPPISFVYLSHKPKEAQKQMIEKLASSEVPEKYLSMPVLSALYKSNGAVNWNHYAVIVYSKEMGTKAIRLMRENPWLILDKAIKYYFQGYSTYEARNTYSKMLVAPTVSIQNWMLVYEFILFKYFAFVFPAIILLACFNIFRQWEKEPAIVMTAVFMLYCILWVLAMALLVDGMEGNRMHFSTEPFIMILAGWVVNNYLSAKAKEVEANKVSIRVNDPKTEMMAGADLTT